LVAGKSKGRYVVTFNRAINRYPEKEKEETNLRVTHTSNHKIAILVNDNIKINQIKGYASIPFVKIKKN